MTPCTYHPTAPSVQTLDGDRLCQACADAWVRAEGRALMEADARHDAMLDAADVMEGDEQP